MAPVLVSGSKPMTLPFISRPPRFCRVILPGTSPLAEVGSNAAGRERARRELPEPGGGLVVSLAAPKLLQAFGAAHDPPDEGEDAKDDADQDDESEQAQRAIEQADPKGAY